MLYSLSVKGLQSNLPFSIRRFQALTMFLATFLCSTGTNDIADEQYQSRNCAHLFSSVGNENQHATVRNGSLMKLCHAVRNSPSKISINTTLSGIRPIRNLFISVGHHTT